MSHVFCSLSDTLTLQVTLDGRPLVIEDRNRGAKTNAPRAQGQSQPKPAGAKRGIKTGGKSNDNAAH